MARGDKDDPRTYGPAIDLQSLEVRKAHYAAALEIWRTLQHGRDWLKPSGPPHGLTREEALEVETCGYSTEILPARCANPEETPTQGRHQRFEEAEAGCWACGTIDDNHLLYSFYCSIHCHSINHHLPTVESLNRFGEQLRAIVEYAHLGGTEESFLESCGIAASKETSQGRKANSQ